MYDYFYIIGVFAEFLCASKILPLIYMKTQSVPIMTGGCAEINLLTVKISSEVMRTF